MFEKGRSKETGVFEEKDEPAKPVIMSSPRRDLLARVATREYSPDEVREITDTCEPEYTGPKFEREQLEAQERRERLEGISDVSPTSGEVPHTD